MFILILFAFVAGFVTVLSPCILPLLPIILSSSYDDYGRKKPIGIILGFITSFTFFTLFLSLIVKTLGISADSMRNFAILILFIFGLSLLWSKFQFYLEIIFSKLSNLAPSANNHKGFFGGVFIGISLGLLWTPCVGPILASVISLAISGSVTWQAFLITLSYSIGTAIPMFVIMILGNNLFKSVPSLVKNAGLLQKTFGVLMIVMSIVIFYDLDKSFQSYFLSIFPNYADSLTSFENNTMVENALKLFSF